MMTWETRKLGTIVNMFDNLRIPVAEALRVEGQTPYYGANGIQDYVDGYTHDGEFVLLAEDGANDLRNYPIRYVNGKVWVNNHAHVIQGIPGMVDTLFLSYALKGVDFQSVLVGGTRAKLNGSVLREIEITIPMPLSEQHRIAGALYDTDALVTALERLIAKKRAIKQGTMQELLTGKRRLPGFNGEFVNMNLVANSTLKARIGWQGLTTAEYLDAGYAYLITGTDFDNGTIAWGSRHHAENRRYDQDKNMRVGNGDILITKDGTIGKVAIVSELHREATLNSGVFVLRAKTRAYDHKYVYYVLLSQIFIDFLDKLAAGSTITHLYQKDFANFEFDVPPTIDEQTAIAEILSDMDAEIDKLTARLKKLRNIKQGMMSELLTGRIRLVEQDATTYSENLDVAGREN